MCVESRVSIFSSLTFNVFANGLQGLVHGKAKLSGPVSSPEPEPGPSREGSALLSGGTSRGTCSRDRATSVLIRATNTLIF